MKETIVWSVLFALGLVMVLFRMDISRYLSDITGLLVTGSILSVFSGAGMLMEWYKDKQETGNQRERKIASGYVKSP